MTYTRRSSDDDVFDACPSLEDVTDGVHFALLPLWLPEVDKANQPPSAFALLLDVAGFHHTDATEAHKSLRLAAVAYLLSSTVIINQKGLTRLPDREIKQMLLPMARTVVGTSGAARSLRVLCRNTSAEKLGCSEEEVQTKLFESSASAAMEAAARAFGQSRTVAFVESPDDDEGADLCRAAEAAAAEIRERALDAATSGSALLSSPKDCADKFEDMLEAINSDAFVSSGARMDDAMRQVHANLHLLSFAPYSVDAMTGLIAWSDLVRVRIPLEWVHPSCKAYYVANPEAEMSVERSVYVGRLEALRAAGEAIPDTVSPSLEEAKTCKPEGLLRQVQDDTRAKVKATRALLEQAGVLSMITSDCRATAAAIASGSPAVASVKSWKPEAEDSAPADATVREALDREPRSLLMPDDHLPWNPSDNVGLVALALEGKRPLMFVAAVSSGNPFVIAEVTCRIFARWTSAVASARRARLKQQEAAAGAAASKAAPAGNPDEVFLANMKHCQLEAWAEEAIAKGADACEHPPFAKWVAEDPVLQQGLRLALARLVSCDPSGACPPLAGSAAECSAHVVKSGLVDKSHVSDLVTKAKSNPYDSENPSLSRGDAENGALGQLAAIALALKAAGLPSGGEPLPTQPCRGEGAAAERHLREAPALLALPSWGVAGMAIVAHVTLDANPLRHRLQHCVSVSSSPLDAGLTWDTGITGFKSSATLPEDEVANKLLSKSLGARGSAAHCLAVSGQDVRTGAAWLASLKLEPLAASPAEALTELATDLVLRPDISGIYCATVAGIFGHHGLANSFLDALPPGTVTAWSALAYSDRPARLPGTLLSMSPEQVASAIACRDLANPGGVVNNDQLPAEASVLHALVRACLADGDRSAEQRLRVALRFLPKRVWTAPDASGGTPFGLACRHPRLRTRALPVLTEFMVPPDWEGQCEGLELAGYEAARGLVPVERRFRQAVASGRTKCHELSAAGLAEAVTAECHATPAVAAVLSVANELPVDLWPGSAPPPCLDPHTAMVAAAELATKGSAPQKQLWKDRLKALASIKRLEGFVVVARAAIAAELGEAGTALLTELAGSWTPPPDASAALAPAAGVVEGAGAASPWENSQAAPLYGFDVQPLRASAGRAVLEAARYFRLAAAGGRDQDVGHRIVCPAAFWAVGGIVHAPPEPEGAGPTGKLLGQSYAEASARVRQSPLKLELRAPTNSVAELAAAAADASGNVVSLRCRDAVPRATSLGKVVASLARAPDLREIDMAGTTLSASDVESLTLLLAEAGSGCALNLSACGITGVALESLASAMARRPASVTSLCLADNTLGGSDWEAELGRALSEGACTRGHLDLSGCGLRRVHWLAEACKSAGFALQSIDLSRNKLGDESAEDLATLLKSASGTASVLLGGNSMSSAGAAIIAQALGESVPSMWTVSLAGNLLDCEATASIGAAIGADHRLFGRSQASVPKGLQGTTATAALAAKLKADGVTSVTSGEVCLAASAAADLAAALGASTALTTLDLSRARGLRGETARLLAEQVKANTTLATLNLAHCDLDEAGLQHLADALSGQDHLTCLDLQWCSAVDDAAWTALAAACVSHGVKRLNLAHTALPEAAAEALAAGSTTLESLALSSSSAAPVAALLSKCPSLSDLSVTGGASLTDEATSEILKAVATSGQIQTLRLGKCESFAGKAGAALANLFSDDAASAKLTELEIVDSNLTGASLCKFAPGLAKASSLTRLSLASEAAIGGAGLRRVCNSVKSLPALAELDMSGCGASSGESATSVKAVLEGCTALTSLNISDNAWGDSGCDVFAPAVAKCPKLQRLDASGCGMGAGAVAKLAASAKACASLVELSVSRNWAGSLGGAALAEAIKGPAGLAVLQAAYCGLEGPEVSAIAAACQADSRLAKLGLARNGANEAAAKDLGAAIDRCGPLVELELDGSAEMGGKAVAELAAKAAAKGAMRRVGLSGCMRAPETEVLAQLLSSAAKTDCVIVW